MPTPKFDMLCIDFVKRIPDQLVSNFVAGSGVLPRSNLLSRDVIVDYVNRGLMTLFNNYWKATNGDVRQFISIFPELQKVSAQVSLSNGVYTIGSGYKDFYKLIGAYIIDTPDKIYAKVESPDKFIEYETGKLYSYQPTASDPVIIHVEDKLYVYPKVTKDIVFTYVRLPVLPSTGAPIIQNGSIDSPYNEHWHKEIVDTAYTLYLTETAHTV